MADRTVKYRLEAEIAAFKAQMAQASASTKKLAGDLTALDKNGAQMRQGMTVVGGAAGKMGLVAAAGIGAATKAAIDWETAWAGVTKTTDGTAAQMAALEGELRELARTMPATHQEIAAVAEAAGQLGVERESVASFTETMLQLGETTNLTADEAATSIAQMANVMQTAPDEIDNLGAALVALGNDGASTERDIIQMSQRISAAGAQIGLAESDILAIANAAASMGVEVEAGGTSISRVFTELAKATSSGGPKLEAFAEVAGVSADEFRRLFAETPADAFAAFTGGLDRINKSGGDVFSTLKALGLSDVRVSQALLGMAASGDLLTDSLKLGREAWQENTALSDEFAKRLGTTASQVQVSWNNIKDAGIDAGAAMLPVVEGVAKGVSTLANAFGALPGPAKTAAGGVLALTAAAGGTVWAASKMVNAFASGKQALADLGITSDGASRSVGRFSGVMRGAAAAGGAFIAWQAAAAGIRAIQEATDESLPGIQSLTGRLLELSETGSADALGKEFASLGESIDRIADPGRMTAFSDALMKPFGAVGGEAGSLRQATAEVEALDAALAALVASAGPEAAERAMRGLQESGNLSAAEFKTLNGLLPQYTDAMAGAANQTKIAAGATTAAGDAAGEASSDFAEMAKAQAAARKAARETATSFFNLGDSLNDSKVSLRGWIQDMADQANALRNFRVNAQAAADKGLRQGLIAALQEAGPEGARRMAQLANATQGEIRKANRAWSLGQREIRKYTNEVGGVPGSVGTHLKLSGVPAALANLRAVRAELNATDGDVATAYVRVIRETRYTTVGNGPGKQVGGFPKNADGGLFVGRGGPRDDTNLTWISNREFIVNAASTARHLPLLEAINADRFADGGLRGAGAGFSAGVSVGAPAVSVSLAGARITAHFPGIGQIEGVVREVARDVVSASVAHDESRRRVGA